MNKRNIIIALSAFLLIVGVGYAAFADRADVLGTSVSVGSADLRLLNDLAGGVVEENLVETIPGPSYTNVGPNWTEDYLVKIFNNGTSTVQITTQSNYLTADDPEDLRGLLFVEPFQWDDINNDGIADTVELGTSYGRKSFIKWKTEGFVLEDIPSGGVGGYVLRLSTDSIPDSKQGATALFDFQFHSLGQ